MNDHLTWRARPGPYNLRMSYRAGDYGKLSAREGLLTGYTPGAVARLRLAASRQAWEQRQLEADSAARRARRAARYA